jgi:cytochrome c oxidase subunit 3/cytochrome o ubiquinol oxidase subunit 3
VHYAFPPTSQKDLEEIMAQTAAELSKHSVSPEARAKHPPTALGLNSRKLGLWAFIGSETIFFAALITTYLVMKPVNIARGGPHPEDFLGITLTTILASILLASSLTMVLALNATERNDRRGMLRWLGATILLGLAFLGGQVYEFNHLFHEHFITVTVEDQNSAIVEQIGVPEHDEARIEAIEEQYPESAGYDIDEEDAPVTWTTSVFGSTFFTLTGFHGTHVAIGVAWLAIVLIMALRGKIGEHNTLTVEMAGLYWHFVDLVWVAIFVLIYLI